LRIDEAGPDEMTAVLARSHEVWGEGMSLDDYTRFNLALKDSDWGRKNYRFLIARDDSGGLLSSLKLYNFRTALDGRPLRTAGIGALFTPPDRRGQGHAAALLEEALRRAGGEGAALALLVSEIGASWYEKRGFRTLPATEAACRARMPAPWPKEPQWVGAGDPFMAVPGLRPGRPDDLEALVAIHQTAISGQRFRMERDRAAWDYALLKSALAHRVRGDGEEQLLVIEEGGPVAAYAFLKQMPEALRWKEHGTRPGSEARSIDLFWCALALARRSGKERVEGWFLPPAPAAGGAYYPIARRTRTLPAVMARALDTAIDLPRFTDEEECRVFELDSF